MRTKPPGEVISLSEFRNDSAEILEKINKTRRPLILTQRGRSVAVVEGIKEYENKKRLLEVLRSIVKGIGAVDHGDRISHKEARRRIDDVFLD